MKIYTHTGDQGETELRSGGRLSKDDPRLETLGTIDELCALLGLVRAEPLADQIDRVLGRVQNELFEVGAELATLGAIPSPATHQHAGAQRQKQVQTLEENIDLFEETLPPLGQFILPSGTRAASGLHLARTVCRRAERRLVTLTRADPRQTSSELVRYFNRLGDLLFVLARAANARAGRSDLPWQRPARP